MKTNKRWQFYLILAVIALTIYNILPTIFYYSKPLRNPIDSVVAEKVANNIVERVNNLEKQSLEWVDNFCKHLKIKPEVVALEENNREIIKVSFKKLEDAAIFRNVLYKAGEMINFPSAQLTPMGEKYDNQASLYDTYHNVYVKRKVGMKLDSNHLDKYFKFIAKTDANGDLTEDYKAIVFDRVANFITDIAGASETYYAVRNIIDNEDESLDAVLSLASDIVSFDKYFGAKSQISHKYYRSFSQGASNKSLFINNFRSSVNSQINKLSAYIKKTEQESIIDGEIGFQEQQRINNLNGSLKTLQSAEKILRSEESSFKSGSDVISYEQALQLLKSNDDNIFDVSVKGHNPFIERIIVDLDNDVIVLAADAELEAILDNTKIDEEKDILKEQVNKLLIGEIAKISQKSGEDVKPYNIAQYAFKISSLSDSQSMLLFKLDAMAKDQVNQIATYISENWNPVHNDLKKISFPVWSQEEYNNLDDSDKFFGLLVTAPVLEKNSKDLNQGSIYIIAKGLSTIIDRYQKFENSEEYKVLATDINNLQQLLYKSGVIFNYRGDKLPYTEGYKRDIIFEKPEYYKMLLNGSRENFQVYGSKNVAILEFSDLGQRMNVDNNINTDIHAELLKWKDDYNASQVSLEPAAKLEVPPPTKNIFWENIKLSSKKYFYGDSRKILKWGLDLSGGKTVVIELRDQNNKLVDKEEDLKTAVNELTNRVNKMGVSEVSIRREGVKVVMDFPGSQGLSASELIKASAMYFNIINEKFSPYNKELAVPVNQFLQDVWNEAIVTNRKEVHDINEIAWRMLGGDEIDETALYQLSDYAKILRDNGLRLAGPDAHKSNAFNDTLSCLAVYRGDSYQEWNGQSNPLVIVFNNYALEGSLLENVITSYNPSEGNILSFSVKGSYLGDSRGNPRDDFYSWTSQFSEDRIAGTLRSDYSNGRGWRMAVILNDQIVSAPSLKAALNSGGMISGSFTQREVTHLASDLKAGSLSFTPRILSEKNISPELGQQERFKGIFSAVIGMVLVVLAMVSVYRFSGIVASIAVIFNLLIMWGVLQNIDAALTLPGIAGIILTIGMAVDANVLVFERIREEFSHSGRIASAVQIGYDKAFTAIVDSNITTIIAALILIQFDSGPIKGFATTLIIGIASSMFTALFMTRYFFSRWVEKNPDKQLTLKTLVFNHKFDFIKVSKRILPFILVLLAAGSFMLFVQNKAILGMDFTGGYALNITVKGDSNIGHRAKVMKALEDQGLKRGDYQIRELNKGNHLRIQFGMGMELEGKPFHNLPDHIEGEHKYNYQYNPRINWVLETLFSEGIEVDDNILQDIDQNWTIMSGQLSDTMRNNALMGLGFSLVCILIYISFRFEFKYGVSAIICLAHDVLASLGVLAIMNFMGVPIQIDLQIIGALMTIIGYSLNATIIIFDRVREDMQLYRKLSFKDLVNHALNVTLSRTIMTSLTTLLVLLSLVILGGSSIFDFAFIMAIGVVLGTVSSLFIAPILLLYFHDKELENKAIKHKK